MKENSYNLGLDATVCDFRVLGTILEGLDQNALILCTCIVTICGMVINASLALKRLWAQGSNHLRRVG